MHYFYQNDIQSVNLVTATALFHVLKSLTKIVKGILCFMCCWCPHKSFVYMCSVGDTLQSEIHIVLLTLPCLLTEVKYEYSAALVVSSFFCSEASF